MKLTSNIATRGRWIRAASGAAFIAIAAIAFASGFELGGQTGRWGMIGVAGVVGVFQIFEALTGWCVARALGFKTPV